MRRHRQEQAAFEERRHKSAGWATVRQIVGYSAVIGLLSILGVSGYLLLTSDDHARGTSLPFGNTLLLIVAVWKVALRGAPNAPVDPTTAPPELPRRFAPRVPGRHPGADRTTAGKPKKHTILFLATNPLGADRVVLDREARAIQVELERSGFRDRFEVVTRWAAEPLDLLRELRKLKPTVVHFSCHGTSGIASHVPPSEPRRDANSDAGDDGRVPRGGLFFQGPDGSPQHVSTEALEATFGAAGSSVQLIVLSACYSEADAQALLQHVDCVVGISGAIADDSARTFAIGFYGGLGERASIAAAVAQGRAAIRLQGLEHDRPQLAVRPGVDADTRILAADSAEDPAQGRSPS